MLTSPQASSVPTSGRMGSFAAPSATGKYCPPHKRTASAPGGLTPLPKSSSPPQRPDSWRSPAKLNEGAWRATAPLSSSPPKQTTWRSKSDSPQSSRPKGLTPVEARVGTIANLPVIPEASPSVLHAQLARSGQTNRFFDHPVLIVGALSEGTVKILPLTSFGGSTVSEKWSRAANKGNAVKWYVPVDHTDTERLGQIPILSTEGDSRLLKQSYVNIREEFTVEISHLGKLKTVVLTKEALQQLDDFRKVVASGATIVV
ncbi:hypothetical protein K490DRAFT_66983 [Saccharata proteae CBS 121410]|uniref:Uncharacterized protein n=1 Tax=Saccharata proteae CBS 121410 TaxID=1314787 RepID=A0A9P4LXG4_9PEZI|nr:hypothetical protein K490DRAFT_66983 [Saccharata proteae CBS 121410]